MSAWRNIFLDIRRSFLVTVCALRLAIVAVWDITFHRESARSRIAARLRKTLEYLGPTFVKLGQFLAIRFDLLPAEFRRELNHLFENVEQLPYALVRKVIENELDAPLAQLFSSFNSAPIASASMAQVHEANTIAGERVAVKVQRPNVDRLLRADLRIMRRLAAVCDALKLFGALELTEVVAQFGTYTERELDFYQEGRTADILRSGATRDEIIPRIYWDLTTTRVLTLEFIDGVSLAEIAEGFKNGDIASIRMRLPDLSMELVLHRLANAFLRQMFVAGHFHGDPHPGNILVCPGNRIALVDFGIAGELGVRERRLLAGFMEHLALGDFEEGYRSYSQLFWPTEATDMASFKRETLQLMRLWHRLSKDPSVPPELRMAGRFSDRMSLIVRNHHLRMSLDTLLFWRVLIILDSSALRFATQFDMLGELHQFFVGIKSKEFFSNWLAPPSLERVAAGLDMASRTLRNQGVVLGKAASPFRHGRVVVDTEYAFERRRSRELKRILGTVIAASAVLGLSMLVSNRIVVTAAAWGALGLMFYLAASFRRR